MARIPAKVATAAALRDTRPMAGLANFHTVYFYAERLCVRCRSCDRRAALGPDQLPAIHSGNMTPVHVLRLRCGLCGDRDIEKIIPASDAEVERFLAGEAIRSVAPIEPDGG